MRDILQKYQDRLVDISGRNRSLVLKRLYKKRAFDVAQMDRLYNDRSSEVASFLLRNDCQRFLLLDDPYRDQQQNEKNARDRLKEEYDDQKAILSKLVDEEDIDSELSELKKEYQRELDQALAKVEERHKSLIALSQGINYLYREVNSVERETGRQELFLGYPFVEGVLLDGSFVRAPLMLFPIRLMKDKNRWYLEKSAGVNAQLNKVLVFAHAKANEVSPPELEWELSDNPESIDEIVALALGELESHGIPVSDIGISGIQVFKEYTKDTTPSFSRGTLVLRHHLILGQFPTSNSIYADYRKLKTRNIAKSPISSLLSSGDTSDGVQSEMTEPVKEVDHFFISPLDHSQEKAVQRVGEGGHIVIHGPPGTGKSETIANIITNSLAKGKRVLMVSQKRAALDVVHNRLAPLHSKMVLLHDGVADKRAFYNHVSSSLEYVEKGISHTPMTVKLLGQQVDEELNVLQKSWTTLHSTHECGLSLQQLYIKTSNLSDSDIVVDLVVRLGRSNPFEGMGYEELELAKQNLTQDGILEAYLQCKALSKYPLLRFVNRSVNRIDVLTAEAVLRDLEVNGCAELKKNDWFGEVLQKLQIADYPTSQDLAEQIASEIISEQCPELLEPCSDGRWWTLGYWLNYSRDRKMQQEKHSEYHKRLERVSELIATIVKAREDILLKIKPLSSVFSSQGIELFAGRFLESDDYNYHVLIDEIKTTLDEAENYGSLLAKISRLSEEERTIADFVYECMQEHQETPSRVLQRVAEAYLLLCLREQESASDARELLVDGDSYEKRVANIKQSLQKKRKTVPNVICSDWTSRFLRSASNHNQLKYQANKRSHLWPIRKYVGEFTNEILRLFPCWLMGPEAVSDAFPLESDLFDVIIFDEASQMFVENAIPAIFRAKQVVVAGDARQLRPDDLFARRLDEPVDDDVEAEMAPAAEVESLLDLAVVNFGGVNLNYHYRSRYAELIDFSNYAFYKAQLQVSPNNHTPKVPPIERIKVNGKWSLARNNLVEAKKVVEIIDQLLRTRQERETIGVVTFNHTQKDLIQDLLDHQAINDPSFAAMYAEEQNRQEGNQDVGLFVKNIENVQGDERDIIIFSVGYGPDQHNRVRANFGSLNREGGGNRLNVAVSRAKKKIYLVTSIEPEDLRVEDGKSEGPKLLKAYLEYTRAVSAGDSEVTSAVLSSLLDTGVTVADEARYDSMFEEQVAEALRGLGYDVRSQIGVSGYRIDLGVYDEPSSAFILGIECDGATYHSSKSARERDIHRQTYLESRGWTIARVWSTDWWKDQKNEIQRLVSRIEQEQKRKGRTLEQLESVAQPLPGKPQQLKLRAVPKPQPAGKGKVQKADVAIPGKEKTKVSYGDEVWLTSTDGAIAFPVELEENPHNKHLMKSYERELLGKQLYDEIEIVGHIYRIDKIKPLEQSS